MSLIVLGTIRIFLMPDEKNTKLELDNFQK